MKFENLLLKIEELPKLEESNFKGLDKDFLSLRLTFISIVYLILVVFSLLLSLSPKLDWWMPLIVVTVPFLILLVVELIGFKIKGYALRQNDISYKSGLIFFSITSVPFNRVQHTEVTQNPLARMFDLATVKVYTAGGSTSDIKISGLKEEDAHQLKDYITKISSQYA